MKKTITLLTAILVITMSSFAQQNWSTNGNSISTGDFLGTKNNQPLLFKTNGGVSTTPQMVITAGTGTMKGYVGINILEPKERLHINQGGILVQSATSYNIGPFLKFQGYDEIKISLQLENKGLIGKGLTFKLYPNKSDVVDNILFVSAIPRLDKLEGAIGIGTNSPYEKLNIKDGNVMISGHNAYNDNIAFYGFNKTEGINDFGGMAYLYSEEEGLALFSHIPDLINNKTYPLFISNSNNITLKDNIGFGTNTPTQKLHVASGNILITKNNFNQHAPGNENGSILFGDIIDFEHPYGHWGIGYVDMHDNKTRGLNFWKPWDNYGGGKNAVLFLSSAPQYSGNVGIGTSQPTQKLSVNGTVLAKEVIVSLDDQYWPTTRQESWPDYVFSPEYKLINLIELKSYINHNKHLPGIPSASEISNEGIHLGEMNAILVEKIEELTLYIIDLQEQINELKQQLQNK